jgi:hypothetical protein
VPLDKFLGLNFQLFMIALKLPDKLLNVLSRTVFRIYPNRP